MEFRSSSILACLLEFFFKDLDLDVDIEEKLLRDQNILS